MLGIALGRQRGELSVAEGRKLVRELQTIPGKLERFSPGTAHLQEDRPASIIRPRDFLYLGRQYNFPIALEGALKLKEISYIHAEGYPSAEMKHGPIALISTRLPERLRRARATPCMTRT